MPKVKYRAFLDSLQNLIGFKPSPAEIGRILNKTQNAMSNRIANDGYFSEQEQKIIKDFYKNSLNSNETIDIVVRGDVSASMGYGITIYDETQTGTYQISKKLADDLGILPNKTEMILASGDSMLPTIESGDCLLIDLNKKDIYDGRIYCVRIDGQLYAKRLQKIPPSKLIVISDNPKYESFEIDFKKQLDFDFEVIGEIRWSGRIFK